MYVGLNVLLIHITLNAYLSIDKIFVFESFFYNHRRHLIFIYFSFFGIIGNYEVFLYRMCYY